MRAHYFQHVPFEGLGSIEPWLTQAGYTMGCTRFYAGDPLPDWEDVDLLVVLGGPMSVNDEALYPWLVQEKQALAEAIHRDIPVLGICLGAQLIACACGSRVYPHTVKEIGWFMLQGIPVPVTHPSGVDGFRFPSELAVFQWHGDTFDLPSNARLLVRGEVCEHQAFQILGKRVLGLQFHLETTPESLRALIEHCADELAPGPWVQEAEAMQQVPESQFLQIHAQLARVLSYLCQPASVHP
jgi:GMP synthase-like glutamine amidotransferase